MNISKKQIFYTILFSILISVSCNSTYSQEYRLRNNYTTDNSKLPSNYIFDVTNDSKGNIWIATQNGVSRFDGKSFFNYNTKNGLPSNEVLKFLIDKNGTLWVNCFKQVPCYFNYDLNRFETIENKKIEKLAKDYTTYSLNHEGDIQFCFSNYEVLSLNQKKQFYYLNNINLLKAKNGIIRIENKTYTINNQNFINLQVNKTNFKLPISAYTIYNCNKLYTIKENEIEIFHSFQSKPLNYKKSILKFPVKIKWRNFSFKKLLIITEDNYYYEYDSNTFKLLKKIKVSENTNCGVIYNNIFFGGTLAEGFNILTESTVDKINFYDNKNFISINANNDGTLYAGNLTGEVYKYNLNLKKVEKIKLDETAWIRKNVFLGKNILTISDNYYWINFKNKSSLTTKTGSIHAIKNATVVNDSIAFLSTINGIFKLNVINNKVQKVNFPSERIINTFVKNREEYFVVSTSGFYSYNHKKNTFFRIIEKYNFSRATADKDLVFIITHKNEIYVYKNCSLIKIIKYENLLNESIEKINCSNNRLWIATKSGVYIMNYKLINKKFTSEFYNLNENDGLLSNEVFDVSYYKNYACIATTKGVVILPQNIKINQYDINTSITAVEINNLPKKIKSVYNLNNDEKNVRLTLSGIESSGHFSHFIYKINKNWIKTYENQLILNLNNGFNSIEIKAVDNNNYISKFSCKVIFNVETLYYQTYWFWFILLISILLISAIIYLRIKNEKQKNELKALIKLEQQRNKITADLHDEIGSTLSSLQINSSIANKILDKDPTSAKKLITKIEVQSKSISETISDIIWSLKTNKDQLMSLSTRIKNYCSDIIGATEINYSIQIDPRIDTLIQDFSDRKNIILFYKEAINNAVKYSKATQIEIILKMDNNIITLEVKDNGIGFNLENHKGNGLINLKNRAKDLNGSIIINSEEHKGTHIFIQFTYITKLSD